MSFRYWNGTEWVDITDLTGPPGVGVPSGGSTGQVLKKASDTDFDAEWGPAEAGASAFGDLTDVTITLASTGDIIRYNGSAWVDVDGATIYEVAGAVSTHSADTTSVHGIADTSVLLDTADIGVSVQAYSAVLDGTTASFTTADETKLDSIEASADVTDATNVAAAGAVMESDTSTALMQFVVDEDDMVSNSATKVPTQQSVKAYVDANGGGAVDSVNGETGVVVIDAGDIGIVDSGSLLTGTNVETALQEVANGSAAVNVVAASGAAETLTLAPVHKVTMDANCTFTFPTPTTASHTFILHLSGSWIPIFPGSITWATGVAPTYSSPTIYIFHTFDTGTTWYGSRFGVGGAAWQ